MLMWLTGEVEGDEDVGDHRSLQPSRLDARGRRPARRAGRQHRKRFPPGVKLILADIDRAKLPGALPHRSHHDRAVLPDEAAVRQWCESLRHALEKAVTPQQISEFVSEVFDGINDRDWSSRRVARRWRPRCRSDGADARSGGDDSRAAALEDLRRHPGTLIMAAMRGMSAKPDSLDSTPEWPYLAGVGGPHDVRSGQAASRHGQRRRRRRFFAGRGDARAARRADQGGARARAMAAAG